MSAAIVIPARWNSRRLPGKPLLPLAGVPMLDRVLHTARRAAGDGATILVATDDERIADHCRQRDQPCVLSDPAISSGSGRALAAIQAFADRPNWVVNLQGDAPFVPPAAIAAVLDTLQQGHRVATPVVQLNWPALDALRAHKQATPFSGTTCTRTEDGRALWFSKAIIPAIRNEQAWRHRDSLSPVYRHLGLYGYALDALERFEAAGPSPYEVIEGLEQLRFFALGIPIQTVVVPPPAISMSGIDTPQDLELAEQLIARHGDPFER